MISSARRRCGPVWQRGLAAAARRDGNLDSRPCAFSTPCATVRTWSRWWSPPPRPTVRLVGSDDRSRDARRFSGIASSSRARADGLLRDDQRLDATGRIWPRTRAGRARSTRKAPTSATRSRLRPGLQHAGLDAQRGRLPDFPDRFRNGDPANDPSDGSATFYGALPLIFHETWNEPTVDQRQPGEFNESGFGILRAATWPGSPKSWTIGRPGRDRAVSNPIFAARSNHRYDTADLWRLTVARTRARLRHADRRSGRARLR